jgi:trehalose 6-phosphate synthase/phosphatase
MKQPKVLTDLKLAEISVDYRHSSSRLILLDYDGTLVDLKNNPDNIIPDKEVLAIIKQLASDPKNTLTLITGRGKKYISKWFEEMNIFILAEHGSIIKEPGKSWTYPSKEDNQWKLKIEPLMESFTNKVKGSMLEEKNISIVWHYRNVNPELAYTSVEELTELLNMNITPDMNLKILHGKKIVEVKKRGYDKGIASQKMIQLKPFSFILAIGDDSTDEDMFRNLPTYSYSFKVGHGVSHATMFIERPKEVINFLKVLVN